jgi:hypothetical protein
MIASMVVYGSLGTHSRVAQGLTAGWLRDSQQGGSGTHRGWLRVALAVIDDFEFYVFEILKFSFKK